MAGDVSDYILDRPRTRMWEGGEDVGTGGRGRGGEEGKGEEDLTVLERIGGAALRKVIKVSSVGKV
jgi:hypothetical protein